MSEYLRKYLLINVPLVILLGTLLYITHQTIDESIGWDIVSELKTKMYSQVFTSYENTNFEVSMPAFYITEYYIPQNIKSNIYVESAIAIVLLISMMTVLYALLMRQSKYSFFIFISVLSAWTVSIRLENITQTVKNGSFLWIFIPLALVGYMINTSNTVRNKATQLWVFMTSIILFFLYIFSKNNPENVTGVIANSYFIYLFLAIFFLFRISNVIFSLFIEIISSVSVHKGESYWSKIIFVYLIYLINIFILYAQEIKLIGVQQTIFTPITLLIISVILLVNNLKKVDKWDSILEVSTLSITMSLILYSKYKVYDAFSEFLAEFIAISFMVVPTAYLIYLLANFYSLIKQGLPVYKVVDKPLYVKWLLPQVGAAFVILFFLSFKNGYSVNQAIATYYNMLGDYHLERKEEGIAESYLKKSISFDLYNFKANYEMGRLADSYGDKTSATFYLKNALKKTNSAHAYVALTQVLEKENLFFDALFILQSGVKENYTSNQMATYLARMYYRANNLDSSYLYLKKAADLCKECQVEKMNELAYWLENGKKTKIIELTEELNIPKKTSLHPNVTALNIVSGKSNVGDIYQISTEKSLNVLDFSIIFNRVTNNADNFVIEKDVARKILENIHNEPFARELMFVEAVNKYKSGLKTEGVEQLTQLYKMGEEKANLFGRYAAGLLLKEGALLKIKTDLKDVLTEKEKSVLYMLEVNRAFEENKRIKSSKLIQTARLRNNNLDSLYQIAPYNKYWILHLVKTVEKKQGLEDALRFIVLALEDNPNEIELWKEYIDNSLKMNLISYAEDGLNELKRLDENAENIKIYQERILKKRKLFGS